LGGAASVAGLLAGLGARPLVAGVVGDDPEGRIVKRLLAEQHLASGGRQPPVPGSGSRENSDAPPPQSEIRHLLLTDPSRPTTHKQRFLGRAAHHRAHQILRVDCESREPLDPRLAAKLAVAANAALPACQAVLISDYAKGVCTPRLLADVIAAARGRRLPVLVDPARGADFGRYRGASLIKPNRDEASAAVGRPIGSPDEAIAVGRELCRRFGIAAAVITLDVDGLVLVELGGQVSSETGGLGANEACGLASQGAGWRGRHFAAQSRAVCDVTGAGDTVLAVLGLSVANRIDLATACQQAVLAAGLQVERLGVAPIIWDEIGSGTQEHFAANDHAIAKCKLQIANRKLEEARCPTPNTQCLATEATGLPPIHCMGTPVSRSFQCLTTEATGLPSGVSRLFLKDHGQMTHPKITSLDALVPLVSRHFAGGRRVVFTNGCFDLLHLGHVRLLTQAKAAGDVLIVAINDDAGVERLKGPGRPVMRAADRAGLIAALECVDHVLIFDDDTPERLIMSLRPDVLVKGADYERGDVIGQRFVESYGGGVLLADLVPNRSTTSTIERMEAIGEPTRSAGAPA